MGKNKDNLVVVGGIVLIVIVAVFTFVRPSLQKEKNDGSNEEETSSGLRDQYPFILIAELEEQIKNKVEFALIDSRSSTEFRQEHILGAINVDNESIGQYPEILKSGNKLILIGNDSDDLSLKLLAEALKRAGNENFAILSGGQSAWIGSGGRTVRLGNPSVLSDQAKINTISPDELKGLIDSQNSQLYVLDARSEKFYAIGHLPQAKNIPAFLLEENHKDIPTGKKVVFYGGSELETFQVGVMLFDLGISRAQALEGGIEGWKAKSFPVEK